MNALIIATGIIIAIVICTKIDKRIQQKQLEQMQRDREAEKKRRNDIRGYSVEVRGRLSELAHTIWDRQIDVKKDASLTQEQADHIVQYLDKIKRGLYRLMDED